MKHKKSFILKKKKKIKDGIFGHFLKQKKKKKEKKKLEKKNKLKID